MRVLVIDTALDACTAAVFENGRMLGVRSELMARGHSERLGGFVRDAVAEAGGFGALDRIGVTVGPGSFTGLRVGLAFAQGLGAALDLPVVGISTLEALARSKVIEIGHGLGVAAAIDARRGQIYFQTFHDGLADAPPEALDVDEVCRRMVQPDSVSWSLVGSGVPLIVEALPRHWPRPAPQPPTEEPLPWEDLASLIRTPAVEALASLTSTLDPATHPPRPLYLRAPDATPPTRLPGQARPQVPAG